MGADQSQAPSLPPDVGRRLDELAAAHGLPPAAPGRLAALLALVQVEPAAITSIRDPREAVDVHVADALVALGLDAVRDARRLADLGSGGGFPGLVLAIALPRTHVALVESAERKCRFLARAAVELGLANVEVVQGRAEAWPAGLDAHDVVTARALAPLPVLVEYAAPLLRVGGVLVAWKGRVEAAEEADGRAAAAALGLEAPIAHAVVPFRGAAHHRLYVSSKRGPTPPGFPRRPGMARKRPLRAST
jgi:16S rRNA (guanine527-N7)-methyltransferase